MSLDVLQANVRLLAENERLAAERARLIELERFRTELLARVSHDLRTPLNSIIGFGDLLLAGVAGKLTRKQEEFGQAIQRNGRALLAMINDLLDASILSAGRMAIRREAVDCVEILRDLRAATDPVLASAGIVMTWPEESALTGRMVNVDRRRLLQVLVNLLDNARKFTPSGGTIAVEIDPGADRLRLAVTDSGQGIPLAERDLLFRPLGSRPPSPRPHAGLGLGLAIVRGLVELHGGTVQLDPATVRGARFVISIPHGAA